MLASRWNNQSSLLTSQFFHHVLVGVTMPPRLINLCRDMSKGMKPSASFDQIYYININNTPNPNSHNIKNCETTRKFHSPWFRRPTLRSRQSLSHPAGPARPCWKTHQLSHLHLGEAPWKSMKVKWDDHPSIYVHIKDNIYIYRNIYIYDNMCICIYDNIYITDNIYIYTDNIYMLYTIYK